MKIEANLFTRCGCNRWITIDGDFPLFVIRVPLRPKHMKLPYLINELPNKPDSDIRDFKLKFFEKNIAQYMEIDYNGEAPDELKL